MNYKEKMFYVTKTGLTDDEPKVLKDVVVIAGEQYIVFAKDGTKYTLENLVDKCGEFHEIRDVDDIIYDRLSPYTYRELKKVVPNYITANGRGNMCVIDDCKNIFLGTLAGVSIYMFYLGYKSVTDEIKEVGETPNKEIYPTPEEYNPEAREKEVPEGVYEIDTRGIKNIGRKVMWGCIYASPSVIIGGYIYKMLYQ